MCFLETHCYSIVSVFPLGCMPSEDSQNFQDAGHSTQIPCCHGSEDDELDEGTFSKFLMPHIFWSSSPGPHLAIIASCGNKVIDNVRVTFPCRRWSYPKHWFGRSQELRDRLVSPLQTGVTLVAFIDACHSATMLDLPHYKCHGINFRWKEHKTHNGRVNRTPGLEQTIVAVFLTSVE